MSSIASHSIHSHSNAEEGGLSIGHKPKKSRSKVWEKVAWFTRKTKTAKDSKAHSSQETQKDSASPCFKRQQFKKLDDNLVELRESSLTRQTPRHTLCGTSPNLVKAKSRSGVRKARSFNYLKRRKPINHNDENASIDESSLNGNEAPTEMATGTFCDFGESARRRTSRVGESCSNLLNEMTRDVSFKQRANGNANTKRSLSLPMSLLSIGENMISELRETASGSQPSVPTRLGSIYNSWPRKKRQFRSNHYSEALSPPQKQKRLTNLRKTATFNGFDKFSTNEDKLRKKDYIKSSPLLDLEDSQIKNQNGLEIGIIHFFKGSSNSNCVPVVHVCKNDADDNCSQDSSTDDRELLVINAHSSLGELVNTKDWENKPLQLLSPELPHPSNELDGHTNGIIECTETTSDLSDNFDSIKQTRSVEYGTSINCPTEHAQDICQLNSHIADRVNPELDLSSPMQYSKPDQLEVICEVFDDAVEDDDDKLNNSQIGMETVLKADGNYHTMCMTETCQECEPSNCHLVDKSSPSLEFPRFDESSFNESCSQSIDNLPQKDMDLDSVNCFGKDSKSVQNDKLQNNSLCPDTNNFNNNSCNSSAKKKFSLDANVYCIKIEDQTTDFLRKNERDGQEIKFMPQTIREHVTGKDNELSNNLSSEEGLSNLNSSLIFQTDDFKTLNHSSAALNGVNVEDIGNAFECGSQIDRKVYGDQEIYHGEFASKTLLKRQTTKVSGQQFKQKTEDMMEWFSDFNNEQKNIFIRRLLEKCELPQMHMLSVIMEPALHKTCPSNCQDMLAWLPHPATERVLSYLDPVSLCRCSQVNKLWNNLASRQLNWKRLCRSSDWQLSRNAAKKQTENYTLPSGIIQWKKMFAERFLLRRKWLNGRCRVRTFEGHSQGISCVQFDDTRIVSGSSDKTIKVWDLSLNDSQAVLTLAGHSGTVRCLNLNGNRLVSGSVDKSIKVWDLSFESYWSGASCKVTMVGHVHTVRCLQVDDQKVVSGSYDKTLKVWDIKTGNCKLTLRGHNAAVLCVQFDETKIVSGSYDNTIKVWSLQEGECLMTLTGHHDAVTCLNLTQDCRKVISGSLDHNLKFWDLATGKCIGTLDWIRSEGHTGVIRCLQSDSWRIVSAGDDKTLKMWSLETGQRLLTLRCHTDGVTCLQFNDYMIVSGSYDKTVKVWSFVPEHEFLNPS